MNDPIIENLLVLEYLKTEYKTNLVLDEEWYNHFINFENFKIIKDLLIVKNEVCTNRLGIADNWIRD